MEPISPSPQSESPSVSPLAIAAVSLLVLGAGFIVYRYILSQADVSLNRGDASGAVTLTLQSTTPIVIKNETFTVNAVLNTGTSKVTAAELHLSFPANLLQGISIQAGPFLPTVLTPGMVSGGTASIVVGSGIQGVQGTGTVAILTFKALEVGSAVVNIDATTLVAAVGEAGNVLTSRVPITITITTNPPTGTFSANPTAIKRGLLVPPQIASSTLSWNIQNATSVSIDQGIGTVPHVGTRSVTPTTTTTYTLTASNEGATITRTATVTVSKMGDIEPDGDVDIFDYNVIVTQFNQAGQLSGDLNLDGIVNLFDYNIMVTNFGL